MKTKLVLLLLPIALVGFLVSGFISTEDYPETKRTLASEDGCVFMTTMGEQSSEGFSVYKTNENVQLSVRDGLSWLAEAQLPNGGFGAGSHAGQYVRDPHAVPADPATTAIAAQAFLRSGITLKKGNYANHLKKVISYLLETVENSPKTDQYITDVRGTQIQRKLG
ncbi:MAG TPA: hypothetical protein DEA82_08115 [Flavobacteriaceae bacterium]|nr:hypothetical protein [Flavobacteriaceae bacterium]